MMRIGHGVDVHRFAEQEEASATLVLGGILIPWTKPLLAHSDGDVLAHALCDALLGALALGDIGQHFPDSDERYRGASSLRLLQHVYALVQEQGFVLGNADMTIVAQAPKMAPHIPAMRHCLAENLQVALNQLSIKATTTEKLGFTGRGEGIAVHAVVLLMSAVSS